MQRQFLKIGFSLTLIVICCFISPAFATATASHNALNAACLQTSNSSALLYGSTTRELWNTPNMDDPGTGGCAASWYETRDREVTRPTGWFWVSVNCAGAMASGLINPGLGKTVAYVFGAGCFVVFQQEQTETVTITEERFCERFWEYNTSQCITQCTGWQ